LFIKF